MLFTFTFLVLNFYLVTMWLFSQPLIPISYGKVPLLYWEIGFWCFALLCRLKQKVVELQTFRQQCGDLEQKVAVFMQEKEQFEKEVEWFILFHTALYNWTSTVCPECRTTITRDCLVNANGWFLMNPVIVFFSRAKKNFRK